MTRLSSFFDIRMKPLHLFGCAVSIVAASLLSTEATAQQDSKKKRPTPPFRWVNELTEVEQSRYPSIRHATFKSVSMQQKVGFCIYLPPQYQKMRASQRFSMVRFMAETVGGILDGLPQKD